jgi:hypothetical protein
MDMFEDRITEAYIAAFDAGRFNGFGNSDMWRDGARWAWNERAQKTWCVYCDAEYGTDVDIALIQAHIYVCPEHPLPKVLAVAYEDARALHYMTHLTKSGVEDFNDCDQAKCVNARAAVAPPTPSVESEGEAK